MQARVFVGAHWSDELELEAKLELETALELVLKLPLCVEAVEVPTTTPQVNPLRLASLAKFTAVPFVTQRLGYP